MEQTRLYKFTKGNVELFRFLGNDDELDLKNNPQKYKDFEVYKIVIDLDINCSYKDFNFTLSSDSFKIKLVLGKVNDIFVYYLQRYGFLTINIIHEIMDIIKQYLLSEKFNDSDLTRDMVVVFRTPDRSYVINY